MANDDRQTSATEFEGEQAAAAMPLQIDEHPIEDIMNDDEEMMSVASTPSLASTSAPTPSPACTKSCQQCCRQYPAAIQTELAADYNMNHY